MTHASRALQKRIERMKDDVNAWEDENAEIEIHVSWASDIPGTCKACGDVPCKVSKHAKGVKRIKTVWGRGGSATDAWNDMESNKE